MPLLRNEVVSATISRTYHVHVPANPCHASIPAIVVFHGGGQDVATIAARWGVDPPNPIPAALADYLLVFPEADHRLGDEWVPHPHRRRQRPAHPRPQVRGGTADGNHHPGVRHGTVHSPRGHRRPRPGLRRGFSKGGGMVWQQMNCDLVTRFQGFAAVRMALDPEKADAYRKQVTDAGGQLVPVPRP